MDKAGRKADLYLPIWRRLELELQKRREADALLGDNKSLMRDTRKNRGAGRGTRTPTFSRQNLNLVRLPIPPYPLAWCAVTRLCHKLCHKFKT